MVVWCAVRQGDCHSALAAKHRLASLRRIYNAPEDATVRNLRPNPNLMYPGDEVYIPDRGHAQFDKPADNKHKFKLKGNSTKLRIALKDEAGKPYKKCEWRLVAGEQIFTSSTDHSDVIEQVIDARLSQATLKGARPIVPKLVCTWNLWVRWLVPVDQMTGIQACLNNLGFHSGPVDGIQGPITTAAVDGIPGPSTQGELKELHGC